jgi:hypothetical protein
MKNGQIRFKPYAMEQMSLVMLPSLEELIRKKHLVQVVNRVKGELDIRPLLAKYKGGDNQLSSKDVTNSNRVCLYSNNLFIAQDRKSVVGKYWIHVLSSGNKLTKMKGF